MLSEESSVGLHAWRGEYSTHL